MNRGIGEGHEGTLTAAEQVEQTLPRSTDVAPGTVVPFEGGDVCPLRKQESRCRMVLLGVRMPVTREEEEGPVHIRSYLREAL